MTSPDNSSRDSAAKRIAAVRARFVEGLSERLAALADLARRAAGDAAAGDSLRLGLHNLSGAAPTLGLVELGRRAAALEARFIAARRSDGTVDAETARKVAEDVLKLSDESD